MSKKRVRIPVQTPENNPDDDPQVEPVVQTEEVEASVAPEEPEERDVSHATEAEIVDVEKLMEEMNQLRTELEQARAEAAEYKDRWLRTAAEMDNMRKRLEKRFADEAEREKRRFLRAILPLVDHLEMVLKHSDTDPNVLRQGVEMIYQDLMRTLEGEGIQPIESVGKPFDPFVHEAVEVVESEDQPENTVVEEVQRGYTYKGELLRPARVRVAGKQDNQHAQE